MRQKLEFVAGLTLRIPKSSDWTHGLACGHHLGSGSLRWVNFCQVVLARFWGSQPVGIRVRHLAFRRKRF